MKKLHNYLYLSILFFATFTACQAAQQKEPAQQKQANQEKPYVLLFLTNESQNRYYFVDKEISVDELIQKELSLYGGNKNHTFIRYSSSLGSFDAQFHSGMKISEMENTEKSTLFTKDELENVLREFQGGYDLTGDYKNLNTIEEGKCKTWILNHRSQNMVFIKGEKGIQDYTIDEFLALKNVNANQIGNLDDEEAEKERLRQLEEERKKLAAQQKQLELERQKREQEELERQEQLVAQQKAQEEKERQRKEKEEQERQRQLEQERQKAQEEKERQRKEKEEQANKDKKFVLVNVFNSTELYWFVDMEINHPLLVKQLGGWLSFVESEKNKFDSEFQQENLAEMNNIDEATLFTEKELKDMLEKIKDPEKRKSGDSYEALKNLQEGECARWFEANKNEKMVLIKEETELKEYTIAQFLGTNDQDNNDSGKNNGLGRKNEAKNGSSINNGDNNNLGTNDEDSSNNKSWTPKQIGGAIAVVFIVIIPVLLIVSKSGSKKNKSQKKGKGTKKKANNTSK